MSTDIGRGVGQVSGRAGFTFSPTGRFGASIGLFGATTALERWRLDSHESTRHVVGTLPVERDAGLLPLDDGTLLLFQRVSAAPEHYEIIALTAKFEQAHTVRLGTIRTFGGYLLPAPPRWATLGIAVTVDDAQHSTIWRVNDTAPTVQPLAQIPGVLSGGTWIDTQAGLLAVNQTAATHRSNGLLVELSTGAWRRIWSLSERSTDRIVCYSPLTRRLVVSSNASGETRLGWGELDHGTVQFPNAMHRPGYPRQVLSFDDRGERVLVHETDGAVSRLYIYGLANDRLAPLECPRGIVTSPANWVGDLIRVPYSNPARPPTVATVRLENRGRRTVPHWLLPREPMPDKTPCPANAELVELPGAAGPLEAIAYGGPDWRYSQQLVIALHGGPLSAWRFEFEPLFQSLAAAGVAVLAANCRGSTGYGTEHLNAALRNWGGPDLDDVRALGQQLGEPRRRRGLANPVVLGASYGAFLALLAACTDPHDWSGCVALAPFLSASGLHAEAGSAVRQRIGELGFAASDEVAIARGKRDAPRPDVLRMCGALRAPLLLAHGSRDERIPVEQSRKLRRRLLELGKEPGAEIDYLELDTDHAGVVARCPPPLLDRITRFCLARTVSTPVGPGRGTQPTARMERG